jgi:hypothetical protein
MRFAQIHLQGRLELFGYGLALAFAFGIDYRL